MIFVYLLPFIIYKYKYLYKNWRLWGLSIFFSLYYVLFPVAPSLPMIHQGVNVVGVFHRFLIMIFGYSQILHIIFYLSFLFALPILMMIIKEVYWSIKRMSFDIKLFIDFCIILFLLIMPFSYMGWEKYFIPVLPFLIIRLLLTGNNDKRAQQLFT